MSIAIHSNSNINSFYLEKKFRNVSDYSKYLNNKFKCLSPGNNASVSVSGGLMQKAMADEKTAKWLEKELNTIPDTIRAAQQAAISHGSKLISVSIEYTEDCTIMQTCGIFGDTGTDSDIDKWLEKIEEDRKEKKSSEVKETSSKAHHETDKVGFDTYA